LGHLIQNDFADIKVVLICQQKSERKNIRKLLFDLGRIRFSADFHK
jgi:hypothetical protein